MSHIAITFWCHVMTDRMLICHGPGDRATHSAAKAIREGRLAEYLPQLELGLPGSPRAVLSPRERLAITSLTKTTEHRCFAETKARPSWVFEGTFGKVKVWGRYCSHCRTGEFVRVT